MSLEIVQKPHTAEIIRVAVGVSASNRLNIFLPYKFKNLRFTLGWVGNTLTLTASEELGILFSLLDKTRLNGHCRGQFSLRKYGKTISTSELVRNVEAVWDGRTITFNAPQFKPRVHRVRKSTQTYADLKSAIEAVNVMAGMYGAKLFVENNVLRGRIEV